jgi:hypothetical protein
MLLLGLFAMHGLSAGHLTLMPTSAASSPMSTTTMTGAGAQLPAATAMNHSECVAALRQHVRWLTRGTNPDAKTLAPSIIASQNAQIGQMRAMTAHLSH